MITITYPSAFAVCFAVFALGVAVGVIGLAIALGEAREAANAGEVQALGGLQ